MTFMCFLNLRKFWSKVVFCNDNFHVWFQKNLSKSHIYKRRFSRLISKRKLSKSRKDNFHVFFKFKKNLDKNDFELEVQNCLWERRFELFHFQIKFKRVMFDKKKKKLFF